MFKELPQFNLKLPYHTFWSILGKTHCSKSNQIYFHSDRIMCVSRSTFKQNRYQVGWCNAEKCYISLSKDQISPARSLAQPWMVQVSRAKFLWTWSLSKLAFCMYIIQVLFQICGGLPPITKENVAERDLSQRDVRGQKIMLHLKRGGKEEWQEHENLANMHQSMIQDAPKEAKRITSPSLCGYWFCDTSLCHPGRCCRCQ